jgi:hypothetical protein
MDLSLLVHTFNQYQFLWPESLARWNKIPENCPFYWGTDTEDHEKHDFGKFQVLYSGNGSWSDRLTQLLYKIPTKYVLYVQEDHWPTKNPPDFTEMMKIVEDFDLKRLQISPLNDYYTIENTEIPLFFAPKSKYLVSHQPSIWDKSFFLECIKYNEDPRLNEYEGTKRLNSDQKITKKIAIYPSTWYHHACSKGKLIPIPES